MTVAALVLDVMADQREIGEFVIERRLIENDDLRIATFVIRVTGGARRPAGATVPAMKPDLCLDVGSDFVMTIETQCALLAALKA